MFICFPPPLAMVNKDVHMLSPTPAMVNKDVLMLSPTPGNG